MSEDDERKGPGRVLAAITVAVLCGLVMWFLVLGPALGDDGDTLLESSRTNVIELEPTVPTAPPRPETESIAVAADPEPDAPESDAEEAPESAPAPTTPITSEPPSAVEGSPTVTTVAPDSPAPVQATAPESTAPTNASPNAPTYPTMEDGSPVPIVVIFDGETIALSGVVPSQAASDRLEVLAIANSSVPNASVANFTTINPDVPINVGVRVIEMQSPRFGESSAEVLPDHAVQLDRAVSVMNALPHISVTVVGHADQRGNPQSNYEISADRAQSVVDYMASRGIDPARMAARAVGDSDLLTLNNDDVAFALNRRTEFIFYGLLVE